MATRLLRLLRAHGIIRKRPKRHRYQLSESGTMLILAVKSTLSASTAKLVDLAA
jgi:DNA-binding IclR family transcriptional regulator